MLHVVFVWRKGRVLLRSRARRILTFGGISAILLGLAYLLLTDSESGTRSAVAPRWFGGGRGSPLAPPAGGIPARNVDPAGAWPDGPPQPPRLCPASTSPTDWAPSQHIRILRERLVGSARCGDLVYSAPGALSDALPVPWPHRQPWAAQAVSLTDDEMQRLDEASESFRHDYQRTVRSLVANVFGEAPDPDAPIHELLGRVSIVRRDAVRDVAAWCLGDRPAPRDPAVTRLALYLMNLADSYEHAVSEVIGARRARMLRWRGGNEPWDWGGMLFLGVSDGPECMRRANAPAG